MPAATPVTPAVEHIEKLLSSAYQCPVVISRSQDFAPWAVMRCVLAPVAGQDLPHSVIVKWLRDDPRNFRVDPAQVRTEQAALEFLAGLGFHASPRLIASDLSANLLILEDYFGRTALDNVIRESGVHAAASRMRASATVAGELNALTSGHSVSYQRHRATYGPVEARVILYPKWPDTLALLRSLGQGPSASCEKNLATLTETLSGPGPFSAMSNGDPQPNNYLVPSSPDEALPDAKIIDFEFAGFDHALVDIAWIYVPGPAWIRVAHPIAATLENDYRSALAQGIPEAEDDRLFGLGMASACLEAAVGRLNRLRVVDERPEGDTSRIQLVATLEEAASAAELHRSLPHLVGWTRQLAEFLRKRWPDADVDLATYPAYAPR